MNSKILRNICLALLRFLGFGAIGCGGVLMFSPNGELMRMPLKILNNSHSGIF